MSSLLSEEWQLSKKQKKLLGYGSVGVAGLYFLYKAYKSDSLTALIEFRERLLKGLDSSSKSLLLASECSNTIFEDLQTFLTSDSDDLPQSLRQLAKLAKSEEFAEATSSLAAAAIQGAFGTAKTSAEPNLQEGEATQKSQRSDILHQAFDLLTTDKGMSLVELAVGVACRSSVKAYCDSTPQDSMQPSMWQQLLEFGTLPKGEKMFAACVGTFVREGTKVWLGGMEGVSGWEDFLSSLCKPERQLVVERLTRTFVNELVVSYLKRSRHGLRPEAKGKAGSGKGAAQYSSTKLAPFPATEMKGGEAKSPEEQLADSLPLNGAIIVNHSGWSSALVEVAKHPEVRSLVLSVAKTASGEGIRSSIFATRDLLLGEPRQLPYAVYPAQQGLNSRVLGDAALQQPLSNRTLGTLLLFIFMPIIIFLAGRRAALA